MQTSSCVAHHEPWNKGKIVGQKAPFKVKDIWALRVRLQMEGRVRELALFNLGIDSKLRGCDLVSPLVPTPGRPPSMAPMWWPSGVELSARSGPRSNSNAVTQRLALRGGGNKRRSWLVERPSRSDC